MNKYIQFWTQDMPTKENINQTKMLIRGQIQWGSDFLPYPVQKVCAGIVFDTKRENVSHIINAMKCT